MSEGFGGYGIGETDADTSPRRTQELSLSEVAAQIERRAISEARSMHYTLREARNVLAAFAVADRLRALASGMEAPSGGETGTGSTEGDSPTGAAGDARNDPADTSGATP